MHKLSKIWKRLTKGWLGNFVYIVLGILIAVGLNEGLKPVLGTDMPVVAVFSDSMVPTFYKGDLIIVCGCDDIQPGDIIVYDAPESVYTYPIIHRVINITEEGLKTKGDHNAAADPWVVPKERVHGKAVARIPFLGWVKVAVYEGLRLV